MNSPGSEQKIKIGIYARDTLVGNLIFDTDGNCELFYEDQWKSSGFPLSPALPFSGYFEPNATINFLKNLFPEGEAFDTLLQSNRISKNNIHAILSTIGHDTSGALTFTKTPAINDKNKLRKITEQELIQKLDSYNPKEMIMWDGKYRLSVAGVQNKLNVMHNKNGDLFLADGQYASTKILKFASKQNSTITINEYFCMKLAQFAGLNVANVKLMKLGKHYILDVHRFDRIFVNNEIRKAHLIDGCQALNLPPSYKYEQNLGSSRDVKHIRDGVNLSQLFDFTNQCQTPGLAKKFILEWVMFNIIIGNSDAHGKNISFLVGKNIYKLSPFYDLVSVVYESKNNPSLDTNLAMAIGDNFDINNITAYDLISLLEEAGLPNKLIKQQVLNFCLKVLSSLKKMSMDQNIENDTLQKSVFKDLLELIQIRVEYLIVESENFDTVLKNI